MSDKHPELVFVAGPQKGQRVVLSRPVAMLGRGGGADILFSEEYVSRNQARYELLHAGPVLENLSSRGTWINSKRYKSGKQVLLDTGDLIGVGQVTEILFVAAGDDVETALAMYTESAAAGKGAFGRKARPEKAPPPPPAEPAEPEPPADESDREIGPVFDQKVQPADGSEARRPSEMSAAERMEAEKKARRRKLFIGLGIYLAVIITIGIILKMRGDKTGRDWPMPPRMTDVRIAEVLRTPIRRTPNLFRGEEELEKAVNLYRQYGLSDSYRLYECFVAFKEALAYNGKGYFDEPEHDQMYRAVLEKLTDVVTRRYLNACIQEKAEEWDRAEKEFFEILRIYRDQSGPLFENIQEHYKRVKHFREKNKPQRRGLWGR